MSIFPITGKENNQSSVSNADREIPTLGSTDNAGNSDSLFSGITVYPRVGLSRSASETDDRFYLSLFLSNKKGHRYPDTAIGKLQRDSLKNLFDFQRDSSSFDIFLAFKYHYRVLLFVLFMSG